jgi:uncharacterized protein (TIGR02145 family)
MNNPTTASPVTTVEVVVDGDPGLDSYIESETVLADDTIFRARSIQLKINLTPDNATADNFGWSVSGAGATVDATGLVTANRTGTITVRATSPNGIFGDKRFVVTGPRTPGTALINGHEYATYEFNGAVWTVDYLKENDGGDGIFTTYNDGYIQDAGTGEHTPGERGYYYTYEAAMRICVDGWRVPTTRDQVNLVNFINGLSAGTDHINYWVNLDYRAGRLNPATNPDTAAWADWGITAYFVTADSSDLLYVRNGILSSSTGGTARTQAGSLRCVQNL